MGSTNDGITKLLNNVSASSAGGSPFLLAYGVTFIITAVLSYILPRETSALIAMFQGAVALPAAFWLENRMGWEKRDKDSPLTKFVGAIGYVSGFDATCFDRGLQHQSRLYPTAACGYWRNAFLSLCLVAPYERVYPRWCCDSDRGLWLANIVWHGRLSLQLDSSWVCLTSVPRR